MDHDHIWKRLTTEMTGAAALPLVEISGNRRVLIEHHNGIMKYEETSIKVKMDYGNLEITGNGLRFAEISPHQVVITGRIASVLLPGGDNDASV